MPFLARELPISEAAAELGVSVARMSYQTHRLVDVGLLSAVGRRTRTGSPMGLYRSTADEFLIAFSDIPGADLEQLLLSSEEPYRRLLAQSLALALSSIPTRVEDLALRLRRLPNGATSAGLSTLKGRDIQTRGTHITTWLMVELSADDAYLLQADLKAVLARWEQRAAGHPTHLLRIALAPLPTSAG